MEVQRRHRLINDQENFSVLPAKGKREIVTKSHGLSVRGALGEMNVNVQSIRDVNVGKVACAAADFEKKSTLGRAVRSNYSHVQSKVDTRRTAQVPSKPVLRREESTAALATRAANSARKVLKEVNKPVEPNNVVIRTKKAEVKKTKLPAIKENKETKDAKTLKPILKESTVSLEKLNLCDDDKSSILKNHTALCKPIGVVTPQLPKDIEDIDANDHSPMLMAVYIKDIYKYLTELEFKYAVEPDHLKHQSEITGKMRATLVDWLVEVQRQFSLILETFQLAIGIIDRYLQVVPNVQRAHLQLIGVTAMYIAAKYEEIYAPGVADFVYITDDAYTKAQIHQCERDIITKLSFCLARPIPLSFLRRFVKAARGTSKNHHLAKYFVDLSLVEYSMCHYRPSELSAAALCLSLYLLSTKRLDEVWNRTLSYYSGYSLEQITPIIKKIAKLVANVEDSKNKAVYKKYQDVTLAKVSTLPQLKSDILYELADFRIDP